jgi:hypothetical protein
MPSCPSCGAHIEQEFGMVTCGECQAVLMININGDVVMGSESDSAQDSSFADPAAEEAPEWGASQNDEDSLEYMDESSAVAQDPLQSYHGGHELDSHDESSTYGDSDLDYESNPSDEYDNQSWSDDSPMQASQDNEDPMTSGFESSFSDGEVDTDDSNLSPTGAASYQDDSAPMNNDFFSSSEESISEPIEEGGSLEDSGADHDPSFAMSSRPDTQPVDVTDYANSDESSLEGGEYLYTLTVSGLDSKELRDTLKAVLMDDKLKLNYLGIMKQVQQGMVSIPDLNPVKAKRIVEQLQFFDLDVRWRQRRVTMEPPMEEQDMSEELAGDI